VRTRDDFAQAICAYGDAAQAFEQILRRGSASAPIDMASPRKDGEAMSKANRGPERARGLRDGDSRFNACSGERTSLASTAAARCTLMRYRAS